MKKIPILLAAGVVGVAWHAASFSETWINIDHGKKTNITIKNQQQVLFENFIVQENEQKKNLESLAFPDTVEFKFFKERLALNTFITPKIIPRAKFERMQWNFLIQQEDMIPETNQFAYKLYLPDSMTISEIPTIIRKVNMQTYHGQIPEYASTMDVKKSLEYTIKYLYANKNPQNEKEMNEAISKYKKLFKDYFPWQKLDSLISNKKINSDFLDDMAALSKDAELLSNVENILSTAIYQEFLESFYEVGQNIIEEIPRLQFELWIDKLKAELQTARKTKNTQLISKKEKEVANKVISVIYHFFEKYQKSFMYLTSIDKSFAPEIAKSNKANCVWRTIISDRILNELWLQHHVNLMFGYRTNHHVTATVTLANGEEYFFDPLLDSSIVKQKTMNKIGHSADIQVGKDTFFVIMGDPEKALSFIMGMNKWRALYLDKQPEKNILYLKKSLEEFNNPLWQYTLAVYYEWSKQYDLALNAINEAIKLAPDRFPFWIEKHDILEKMKIYDITTENMVKRLTPKK